MVKKLPLQQEHWLALSKGGEFSKENIVCACGSCNQSKGDRDFFLWFRKYKYYSIKRENKLLEFLNTNKAS